MPAEPNPTNPDPIRGNCPHCRNPIEVVSDNLEDETVCPSCGSSFHLDPDRTQMWSKDKLPHLGKFELIEQVGRGVFGTVYRARDTQLQRVVAVKVPRSGQLMNDEDEDRFVREARNTAQLQHPGIVPVYEVGRSDEFPYIVSEFVEGVTLADALTARKFDVRESAELAVRIAAALEHAHGQGVVHRDLKPSNIMLTAEGTPRVMDFGLAKRDAGEITMTVEGQVLGTPAYMSPEQASGQAHHVDGRSDVYSLGAILFELLTGQLPFRGNQRMLLHQVLHDEPRAPRSVNAQIPRDLETICLTAMAKDPARRYPSAQAMADDLNRYLAGEPITARPVSGFERGWRWCRRNPVVAGLTIAVAGLAVALGTVAIWPTDSIESSVLDSLAIVLDSADDASAYLRDEVSRSLTNQFSQISALTVKPRSDILQHQDSEPASVQRLGQGLNVKAVLSGSVHVSEDDFEIDLRLLGVDDNREIWTKHFAGKREEISGLQTGILRTVANRLALELTAQDKQRLAQPSVENQAALLHFLRGRELHDRGTGPSLRDSVKEYEQAIELGPGFAEAHGALAFSYFSLAYMRHGTPKEHFEKARASVDKALALDETLVEAKLIDGALKHFFEWDWEAADRILEEVLQLDSSLVETHSCYLHSHNARGHIDKSLVAVRSALMRQPDSFAIRSELGCASYYAHEFENSLDAYHNVLKDDPENYKIYWGLARAYGQLGRYDEAIDALETGRMKEGGEWSGLLAELAYAYAKNDQEIKARQILTELERRETEDQEYVDPYAYAMIYVGLDDDDEAFRQFQRAYELKSPPLPMLNIEPKFAHLRGDARFQALIRSLRLRNPTPARGTN